MRTIIIIIDGKRTNANDINHGQLNQYIKDRRDNDLPVCIVIEVKGEGVDIILTTPDCQVGRGGGRATRAPSESEAAIQTIWKDRNMQTNDFNFGNLNSFLNIIK